MRITRKIENCIDKMSGKGSVTKSRYSEDTHIEGQSELDKFGDLFQDLTKRTYIDTHFDVVSMIIAYGSKFCLAILNHSDEHFEIR